MTSNDMVSLFREMLASAAGDYATRRAIRASYADLFAAEIERLNEQVRLAYIEGFTAGAGRKPKFSELRQHPGMNGIPVSDHE